MRTKLPTLLVAMLLAIAATCQPNGNFAEYWGKVTLADLEIKECAFDKKADALMLYDLGEMYFENENKAYETERFTITTAYYQRVKIFTERGVEQANYTAHYSHANKETISNVQAIAYNIGANGRLDTTVLKPGDVHFKKVNDYETEMTFTVPGVKAGSVLEMSYKRKQYLGYKLPEWYFQSDIPCLVSRISIGFLDAIVYYISEHTVFDTLEVKAEKFFSKIKHPDALLIPGNKPENCYKGTIVTYTGRNLPAVHSEPYMNSRSNYMNSVKFQLKAFLPPMQYNLGIINTWVSLNKSLLYDEIWSRNLIQGGIPERLLNPLVENLTDTLEKAKAIFEFVRSNMAQNNITGLYTDKVNNDVWKQKTGSSADINLLLINALRKMGVMAYPMLTGIRSYGYLNTSYPMREQFKNVVAVVEYGNEVYILDACEKFLPFGQPPYELLNNYGYVIRSPEDFYWHRAQNMGLNSDIVYIKAGLNSNNELTGAITYNTGNYNTALYRQLKANGQQTAINNKLNESAPNITIDNFTDSVDTETGKYTQYINFTAQPQSDNDGNIYLTIPTVWGKNDNEFVNPERISAVDFGFKNRETVVMQIQLPDGYTIDSLPRPTRLTTADTSVTCHVDAELLGRVLLIRKKLEYTQSLYLQRQYPDFYEFHQRLYQLMQQPIVLRKTE